MTLYSHVHVAEYNVMYAYAHPRAPGAQLQQLRVQRGSGTVAAVQGGRYRPQQGRGRGPPRGQSSPAPEAQGPSRAELGGEGERQPLRN